MKLEFAKAQEVIANGMEKAKSEYKRPICVSVCDPYGFLLAFGRMDGAPVRSIEVSHRKAYSSARMGMNTDAFLDRLRRENVPASYFCDERLTALPGGSVIKDADGNMIGALGISGLAPDEDQFLANALSEKCR